MLCPSAKDCIKTYYKVCTSWEQCSKCENFENSGTDLHIQQQDDTCEGQLESNALSILLYVIYNLYIGKFHNFCGITKKRHSYVQCCLHLCQKSFTAFEQSHLCPFSKRYSCLSATTGSHPSAVPHHSDIGVLPRCASKDQTGDNLIVLGQDCRVGLAMVSVQIL